MESVVKIMYKLIGLIRFSVLNSQIIANRPIKHQIFSAITTQYELYINRIFEQNTNLS